ncbi:MAG: hypothetical protein ACRDPY_03650 [Streptosporangiaceae bacterium]
MGAAVVRRAVTTTNANKPTDGPSNKPEPGVLVWRIPADRTYTTTPSVYLV